MNLANFCVPDQGSACLAPLQLRFIEGDSHGGPRLDENELLKDVAVVKLVGETFVLLVHFPFKVTQNIMKGTFYCDASVDDIPVAGK